MESLHLPKDLHWEGKTEPLSPSQIASTSFEELQLFEDNFAENNFLIDDAIFLNSKIAEFEIFELNDFNDNIIIKDDQWLDDKIDPAFAEDYCPEPTGFYPIKQTNTAELLREFESVYDAVEYTHLTPPQTPPDCKQKLQTSFEQQPVLLPIYPIDEIPIQFQANFIPAKIIEKQFPSDDLFATFVHEDITDEFDAQELEEIVRTRANDIPDWNDEDSFGDNSSNSSSSCLSPRSDISYEVKNSLGGTSSGATSQDDEWYQQEQRSKTLKRKTKSRSTEDRKVRKKEQNKNAATRYRQKKKQEIEEILGEERALHDKNRELQTSYKDIKREIKYLKNLMRELYKAKGLLN
jgi:cyclic AMP-dependent transcription factor ATF-4